MNSVKKEIDEYLVDLVRIGLDRWRNIAVLTINLDILLIQLRSKGVQCLVDKLVYPDLLQLETGAFGCVQQFPYDGVNPINLFQDLFYVLLLFTVIRTALDQLDKKADRVERVTDLVGNSCRQIPKLSKLFCLNILGLRLLQCLGLLLNSGLQIAVP